MKAIKALVALGLTLVLLATGYIYQENKCIAMYQDGYKLTKEKEARARSNQKQRHRTHHRNGAHS